MDTPTKLIGINEVLKIAGGVSKRTIYLWMKKGTFPKYKKLGPKTFRWYEKDILDWLKKS